MPESKNSLPSQQQQPPGFIGVSNFLPEHLERIIGETGVTPAINQIELHPRFQQAASRDWHAQHGIVTESYSPLGGKGTELLTDPLPASRSVLESHRRRSSFAGTSSLTSLFYRNPASWNGPSKTSMSGPSS